MIIENGGEIQILLLLDPRVDLSIFKSGITGEKNFQKDQEWFVMGMYGDRKT